MTTIIDFNDLSAGTIVDSEYQAQGVTISAFGGSGQAMAFDTSHPTGGDYDLKTNNLGTVLIVSEDGDQNDPDDNGGGGLLRFDFDTPSAVQSITMLDIEEGAYIRLFNESGHLVSEKYVETDDNGQLVVDINVDEVARMDIVLCGSGAVDNLVFDAGISEDGAVDGEEFGEVMGLGYDDSNAPTNQGGDQITNDADLIFGNGGDDTIDGAAGDDTIYGGSGEDDIVGRESFNWEGASDAEIDNGFSQDTGSVTVTYDRIKDTGSHQSSLAHEDLNVTGIDTGGEAIDDDSGLQSTTNGHGNEGDFEWTFSDPVGNVEFNINDIDGDGVVKVTAFDADGNPVVVDLVGGSKLTLIDSDGANGLDTADSQGGYDNTDSANYNLQVTIAGPVSRILVEHDQDGSNNSGIVVTDIYFDVLGNSDDGNDVITGGAGADEMYGEDGNDTFIVSSASDGDGDVIVGGNGPDDTSDNDVLDLRGAGRVVITDADDASDDGARAGTVTFEDGSTLEFSQIETILFDSNEDPDAEDDLISVDEDSSVTFDPRANDSDPEGDTLEVISIGDPANGTLVDNGDGTFTYTPDPDFNGTDSVTYTISDGNGGEDTATITFDVNPVDDAPVTEDDTAETDEDTPVVIDPLANDSDPDGDPLTVGEASSPDGDVEINPDGTITFTPDPDFNGETTITYTAVDPNGNETPGTITVTVNPVDDAPVTEDDTAETDEDTPVVIDPLANDSDPDGDPLTVGEASSPDGDVEINPDGTITFTPDPDFNGETTITYTAVDPDGNETPGTITVTVNPVDDAPVTEDDTAETDEDTPVVIDPLANDSDPDGDPLTVGEASSPDGDVEINPDGTITFTPDPDFNGETTITYTAVDPDGNETPGTITVTVNPVDDAPVTEDDTAETDEDTPVVIDPLANDSDPDGDPLTVGEASSPDGDVEINPDGTITFTPDPDFNGETTITYTAVDPDGNETPGTITVTVNPVNDAPEARDDNATTPFNTPVVIPVLGNDFDVDGDTLTVVDATSPDGAVEINPDGTITFTPNDGFEGPATVTYTIEDPDGLQDTATVFISVDEQPLDGIVEGTDGDDLIDEDYVGDPEGDKVDNEDAILPGEEPNDDIIEAGEGNDTVLAGEGDDDVFGGGGDDEIDGGAGDDILRGEGDDDTIMGGEGSDTVEGGDGDDVIDTANGSILLDRGFPGADAQVPFLPDLGPLDPDDDPEDDRDSVDGGAGDDTITTGDDRDTIMGGAGEDVIDAGIDDDIVDGGDDADRIVGGEGSDLIEAGEGDDTVYGGNDPDLGLDILNIEDDGSGVYEADPLPDNGRDTIFGGEGNDLIFGADDDDELYGGVGNDTIDGEIDDDLIEGGEGNDNLLGGQGNDTIDGGDGNDLINLGDGEDLADGGADRDTFVNVGIGDTVNGGGEGDDFDILDLTDSAPENGSLQVTETGPDANGNGINGFVTYFDENGNEVGRLDFTDIEEVIPCFTPGTLIATPRGEVRVEELAVGDRVVTRDNGIQEIRWVGAREMQPDELQQAKQLRPVMIKRGALGNGLPERDMMVSPNHRVLLASEQAELLFEEREVLVAAKHLVGREGIEWADVHKVTYIHIMFDQHEVILSDGAWTESFQPGDMSLKGVDEAQRKELFLLFPELETHAGVAAYTAARRTLKKHEAQLICH